MPKKIFHWLFATAFSSSLFFFIITATAVTLIRPDHIKTWVNDSGIYKTLPDTLIKEVQKKQDAEGGGNEGINFKDNGVQDAAAKALSPDFLKSSTEQFVDGTFNWVDGKTDKPDFKIDVLGAKQKFADELTAYARNRYLGLPACGRTQLPKTTDPLTIDCRPAVGLDIDQLSKAYTSQILDNKDFLPDPQITADTLSTKEDQGPAKPAFESNSIPDAYKILKLLPYVLAATTIISAIGFIFTDESKKRGLNKVGRRLVITGLLTFLIILAGSFGLAKLKEKFASQTDASSSAYAFKQTLFSVLDSLQADIVKTSGIIAGVILIIGLIIVVSLKILGRNSKPKPSPKPISDKEFLHDKPHSSNAPHEPEEKRPEPTTAPPVSKPASKRKPPLIQ